MYNFHVKTSIYSLLPGNPQIHYQLQPGELIRQTIFHKQGVLNDTGALCVSTGEFTGRSPQDKFIVHDSITCDTVDWNNFNHPIEEQYFLRLQSKLLQYLGERKEVWMRDCSACADLNFSIPIRVINENAWSNLFCYNLFLRPTEEELANFNPEWSILHVPGFKANPKTDGTKSPQFVIISFTHKTILIGGTAYTGEIKKSIFSVLNFLLPQKNILPMHCSANTGKDNSVAIFFGLSGTGKTTLSTDPERKLIGDDEHGWSDKGIFNFEGGCYAKCINLDEKTEPLIFGAIRKGALLENIKFYPGSNKVNYKDGSITENTRVSYPVDFISNAAIPSVAGIPHHIFFLTCDAYGVLPPISRLTAEQALFHFLSGYTAKVAGTETGITEPKVTFSPCFGAPFLPLHPMVYADLLKEHIRRFNVKVWLINTGWTGGAYGKGKRIALPYTRALLNAALNGSLDKVSFIKDPVFKLEMPVLCPGVPEEILNPINTWSDASAYTAAAQSLKLLFDKNYQQIRECTAIS